MIVDPTWRDMSIADPAPIVDLPVVSINLVVPETECSRPCRTEISRILAQTLNLWRQVCLRCRPGTMAFLVDDDLVYVDTRVETALRDTDGSFFDNVFSASKIVSNLANAGDPGTGHVLATYAVVPRTDPEFRQFCDNDTATFHGMWPAKLSAALCGANHSADMPPMIRVEFIRGVVCGNSDFIACGEPDKKIAISLDGTSYVGSSGLAVAADQTIIGDPSGDRYSLASVLLHEGGHFLGLPHLPHEDLRTNLSAAMLAQVNDETCLSITETMMLNSAADLGWLYRANTCGGLVRSQKGRK
ncbi:hypothetical protein GOB91_09540 [Sinorhizobium meliloti]|uniref:hypothetical protein n=1 Tax=Sinorhizobium TaxID=28105 RepID=UPI000FD8DAFC|nr:MULTISPECIES: hypothetical protein [Sinorhizobium]MDW9722561.1 hypothetical protein [Sinorhizobium meliloti]MDW9730777.1 hypothetical protein [Sinorhizobium meliloti]MDW9784901.1 hypothetical protein [Sinorhizobium meliloti]MDX0980165.1 hypothetical protein [Sinorhizobium medicae]MDX1017065.1 hypothetical protein [Sinorhizobium medicae]